MRPADRSGDPLLQDDVKKRARIDCDYVHAPVDDHSRLAYSEILPDTKGATCAAFPTRAAGHFTDHGITQIERVMTDNHWSYRRSGDITAVIVASPTGTSPTARTTTASQISSTTSAPSHVPISVR